MDLIYDLLTGLAVFQDLFSGTSQDKIIGKVILNLVKAGDLVLRDCISMEFDPRHILMEKRKRKSLMD
jgi:hypothetical protein